MQHTEMELKDEYGRGSRYLTQHEVSQVSRTSKALNEYFFTTFVAIAYGTGARLEEILNTKFSDFGYLLDGEFIPRGAWIYMTVKRIKKRHTLIPTFTAQAIKEEFNRRGKVGIDDYIFYMKRDKTQPMSKSTFYSILKRVVGFSPILSDKVGAHSFRKAYARRLVWNGGFGSILEAICFVQLDLEHASTEMTLRYCGIDSSVMNSAKNTAFNGLEL